MIRELNGRPAHTVAVIQDITERKHAEKQILLLNHELESRVVERTSELRAAVDVLEAEIAEGKRLKAEVLRISENERLRVAADLHDGICQELMGIMMFAHVLGQKLQKECRPLAPEARRIEEAIRETMKQTRELARGMNPVVSDGSGLMDALRQLTRTTARTHRLACSFLCPTPVLIDDARTANELYRIAQEAISNGFRHGHAKRITVRLSEADSHACLAVADNGRGMPPDPSRGPGMGLRLMRYRVGVIGGHLTIQPRKRGGTEVVCRVPKTIENR